MKFASYFHVPPMSTQFASHGRGGAGNISPASQYPKLTPHDLETPILKTSVVTTGRGGTGNMARNDDPAETRLWQDVQAVPRRSSSGTQHWGRGGAGNVFSEEEAEAARTSIAFDGNVIDDSRASSDSSVGFAAKGKQWLFSKKSSP